MAEPRKERREWLAQEFERHRAHLRAVGYRMLGSMTEAEDAVQEAWVRLDRRDPGGTDDLRGWLTVTVRRICLDMLRTRASRRETYAGTWLYPSQPGAEASPGYRGLYYTSIGSGAAVGAALFTAMLFGLAAGISGGIWLVVR